MQQPPGFPPQGPPQGGAPPQHNPYIAQQGPHPHGGQQGHHPHGGQQAPQAHGGQLQGHHPHGQQGPHGYGGPYGPPPAQGFGAGYRPPPIQPPQAAEEPSLLHKVGGGIIAFVTLSLTGVWMVTDSGLYLWLSAIQADMFDGDYYPVLSFLLSWLGLLFPLMPIWLGIVSAIEGRNAFRVAFSKAMQSWDQ